MELLRDYKKSGVFFWAALGAGIIAAVSAFVLMYAFSMEAQDEISRTLQYWYIGAGAAGLLFWAPLLFALAVAMEELRAVRITLQQAHQIRHFESLGGPAKRSRANSDK